MQAERAAEIGHGQLVCTPPKRRRAAGGEQDQRGAFGARSCVQRPDHARRDRQRDLRRTDRADIDARRSLDPVDLLGGRPAAASRSRRAAWLLREPSAAT
jgi:hypothetical protein